jgi:hypothetical protein
MKKLLKGYFIDWSVVQEWFDRNQDRIKIINIESDT